MYYSEGVACLAAFGAGQALPDGGPLWLVARVLFDGAGGLFGLYLLAALGLSVVGLVMRGSQGSHPADRRPAP